MRSATNTAVGIGAVLYLLFWLAAIGGWITNIVKICFGTADPITGLFIFRCIGVFLLPVGAVLGFV